MSATLALLIIAVIFALGDFIAVKTKAVFSMMFVSGLVLLVGFWLFLPKTLFEDAQISKFAIAIIPMLMVYMGTLMKLQDLKDEWKTVLLALASIAAVAIILFLVGSPIIGKHYAVAAAGPISGGVVATLIVQEAANAQGLETIAVFATILLVLQTFVGLPVASFCLSGEAKNLLAKYRSNKPVTEQQDLAPSESSKKSWRLFPETPKSLQTPFILIMKAMLIGWLAVFVAHLLGDVINKYVMALIFGILFYELGFLEHKILEKANAMGITLFALMVPVFSSLPKATPEMILSLVLPILVSFLISIVGITIVSILLGKALGYSWRLSLAIGVTCMFGFPGTFIISEEIAQAVSETAEEHDYITKIILPKMLVGGFTTVTIGSVFLASFLIKLL